MEYHGDTALCCRHAIDTLACDEDVTIAYAFQPCHHAQQGGLAAAGWANEDAELAILDREVDIAKDLRDPEEFLNTLELNT